jgi:hypothetical protein
MHQPRRLLWLIWPQNENEIGLPVLKVSSQGRIGLCNPSDRCSFLPYAAPPCGLS